MFSSTNLQMDSNLAQGCITMWLVMLALYLAVLVWKIQKFNPQTQKHGTICEASTTTTIWDIQFACLSGCTSHWDHRTAVVPFRFFRNISKVSGQPRFDQNMWVSSNNEKFSKSIETFEFDHSVENTLHEKWENFKKCPLVVHSQMWCSLVNHHVRLLERATCVPCFHLQIFKWTQIWHKGVSPCG